MIYRTLRVRVRPDTLIVFKRSSSQDNDGDDDATDNGDGDGDANDDNEANGGGGSGRGGGSERSKSSSGSKPPSLFARVCTGVKEDHSMFAWADTGQWETAGTTDEEARLEADRFRIGFEPLFVDFTKNGSWFLVYCLLEVGGWVGGRLG